MYKVLTTTVFDAWLLEQAPEVQVETAAVILLLREFGHRLSRPHCDTLNGSTYPNMKELRVKTSRAEIRVAFAFDPMRRAVILIAGDKRGVNQKMFYKKLIARADALFSQYLREIKK